MSGVQLSLADQQIMVDDQGSHFQAKFTDIFANYQNPPLTGDLALAKRLEKSDKALPSAGGMASLTLPSGCGVIFEDHLQAEKHPCLASLYCFDVNYTTRRLFE